MDIPFSLNFKESNQVCVHIYCVSGSVGIHLHTCTLTTFLDRRREDNVHVCVNIRVSKHSGW